MSNSIQFVPADTGATARESGGWAMIAKDCLVLVGLLVALAPAALSQALPAAEASPISTGFSLPLSAGTLQYGVSVSQSLVWGYYGGGQGKSANLTGDLAYISTSKRHPFSMVLAGGRSWTESSQPSTDFYSFGLSQVLGIGRWNLVVSDNVSYLPGTATTGLSGVAGVGDLGVSAIQGANDSGQGLLTNNSTRVSNSVSGSLSRQLTSKTSVTGTGSYSLTRFVNGSGSPTSQGLDSGSESGAVSVTHRLDVRNTVGGGFSYSNFTFSSNSFGLAAPSFVSETATGEYTHQFTRRLGMSVSAGPEWTAVSTSGGSSLSLYADVSASYGGKFTHGSLGYFRGTNSGSGVVGGAISDSLSLSVSRTFAHVWSGAATASYSRTSSLASPGVNSHTFNTEVAGGQLSRALARNLSGYASYTLEKQSNPATAAAVDLYSGTVQVVGFGLTYSPTSIRYGRP
jgi:hypothetical protein